MTSQQVMFVTVVLPGMRRPTALMCSGKQTPCIDEYEISTVEPLYDLKNVINRVLEELPYTASDIPELKQIIVDTLTALQGKIFCCQY